MVLKGLAASLLHYSLCSIVVHTCDIASRLSPFVRSPIKQRLCSEREASHNLIEFCSNLVVGTDLSVPSNMLK